MMYRQNAANKHTCSIVGEPVRATPGSQTVRCQASVGQRFSPADEHESAIFVQVYSHNRGSSACIA
jgi:hypothetical protein